jgi:hypothetical protein
MLSKKICKNVSETLFYRLRVKIGEVSFVDTISRADLEQHDNLTLNNNISKLIIKKEKIKHYQFQNQFQLNVSPNEI